MCVTQCWCGADRCVHHPEYRPGEDEVRGSGGRLPDCQDASDSEAGHGADGGTVPYYCCCCWAAHEEENLISSFFIVQLLSLFCFDCLLFGGCMYPWGFVCMCIIENQRQKTSHTYHT